MQKNSFLFLSLIVGLVLTACGDRNTSNQRLISGRPHSLRISPNEPIQGQIIGRWNCSDPIYLGTQHFGGQAPPGYFSRTIYEFKSDLTGSVSYTSGHRFMTRNGEEINSCTTIRLFTIAYQLPNLVSLTVGEINSEEPAGCRRGGRDPIEVVRYRYRLKGDRLVFHNFDSPDWVYELNQIQ